MSTPQGYVLTRDLPEIPAKRYFTIGEVSQLCDVRSYVLRYWEQEFTQLSPMKRRGNRRYYQLHEVELVRKIRALLYEQGFTIAGARLQLEQKIAADVSGFELSPPDDMPHAQVLESPKDASHQIDIDLSKKSNEPNNRNKFLRSSGVDIQAIVAELREISVLIRL